METMLVLLEAISTSYNIDSQKSPARDLNQTLFPIPLYERGLRGWRGHKVGNTFLPDMTHFGESLEARTTDGSPACQFLLIILILWSRNDAFN